MLEILAGACTCGLLSGSIGMLDTSEISKIHLKR